MGIRAAAIPAAFSLLLLPLLAVREVSHDNLLDGDFLGVDPTACQDEPGLNCGEKVAMCNHATDGAEIRSRCRVTCGECTTPLGVPTNGSSTPSTQTNSSADDTLLETRIAAITAAANGSMTEDEAAKLAISGCKDSPEHADDCPSKQELCTSASYGAVTKRQCPLTCGVCQPDPASDETNIQAACTPEPIVASLDNKLLKASSRTDDDSGAGKARLQSESTSWVAGKQQQGQWLEVALPEEMTVTSIATQGRFNNDQWVKSYKLMYKTEHWDWYHGGKWMKGNWDRDDIKKHKLRPFKAKYVRFYPKKWHGKIAMRVEIWGCKEHATSATSLKKMTDTSKKIVNEHVDKATSMALDAVRKAAAEKDADLHITMKEAVKNATAAAKEAIEDAAKKAISKAVERATEMATVRIKHAARHAVVNPAEGTQSPLQTDFANAPDDEGRA